MNYRWTAPELAGTAKPYGFAPLEGAGFLRGFHADREQLLARLDRVIATTRPADGHPWHDSWAKTPHLLTPDPHADVDPGGYLEHHAREAAHDDIDPADLLQLALLELLARRAPFREGAAWTRDTDRLLRRYEAFGRVYASYSAAWRKTSDEANPPALLARLAAAAAWRAVSSRALDTQLFALNALLKLVDRATLAVRHQRAGLAPADVRWLAGAVRLERQMVEAWSREVSA